MKVRVFTSHQITISGDGETLVSAQVDSDNTAKIDFHSEGLESGKSPWLDRQELISLRRIINKALTLIGE
jgi:hypothetical protein